MHEVHGYFPWKPPAWFLGLGSEKKSVYMHAPVFIRMPFIAGSIRHSAFFRRLSMCQYAEIHLSWLNMGAAPEKSSETCIGTKGSGQAFKWGCLLWWHPSDFAVVWATVGSLDTVPGVGCFTFKALSNLGPGGLKDYLHPCVHPRMLQSLPGVPRCLHIVKSQLIADTEAQR